MKSFFIILALFTTNVYASFFDRFDTKRSEIDLKLGGWSHHFEDEDYTNEYRKFNGHDSIYNESHNGLGIEFSAPLKDSNHYFSTGLWYMKDSYNVNAYHLGLGYKYRQNFDFIHSIDYAINLTFASRGTMGISYRTEYFTIKGEQVPYLRANYYVKRKFIAFPAPQITFNFTERLHIDLIGMISKVNYYRSLGEDFDVVNRQHSNYWSKVLFVRFGYKF